MNIVTVGVVAIASAVAGTGLATSVTENKSQAHADPTLDSSATIATGADTSTASPVTAAHSDVSREANVSRGFEIAPEPASSVNTGVTDPVEIAKSIAVAELDGTTHSAAGSDVTIEDPVAPESLSEPAVTAGAPASSQVCPSVSIPCHTSASDPPAAVSSEVASTVTTRGDTAGDVAGAVGATGHLATEAGAAALNPASDLTPENGVETATDPDTHAEPVVEHSSDGDSHTAADTHTSAESNTTGELDTADVQVTSETTPDIDGQLGIVVDGN